MNCVDIRSCTDVRRCGGDDRMKVGVRIWAENRFRERNFDLMPKTSAFQFLEVETLLMREAAGPLL